MSTFFGSPAGDHGKVVALGVRFSHGSARGGGTMHAPVSLRSLTAAEEYETGLWDYASGKRVLDGLSLSDAGDLTHRASCSPVDFFSSVEARVHALSNAERIPLCIGGDHSITLPAIRGVARAIGPVQIVQLDAHHDDTPVQSGSLPTHSNFVSFLLQIPQVLKVVQVGVRGYSSIPPRVHGKLHRCTPSQVGRLLDPAVPVYLTIDSDAFDPSFLPAVRHPMPLGLSLSDLDVVLEALQTSNAKVVGVDWTEYDPDLDQANYQSAQFILFGLLRLLACIERQQMAPKFL